jgi:hypothetical protein
LGGGGGLGPPGREPPGWGATVGGGRARAAGGARAGSHRGTRARKKGGAQGGKREWREREREGERWRAHLGDPNPAVIVTESPRDKGKRERWKRGSCCAGKLNEGKGEKRGARAWGGSGARGKPVGPDWAGLGRGPGQKPTTHMTIDRNPITNQNLKRDETNIRLNTTSDKRNMPRHDATPMST